MMLLTKAIRKALPPLYAEEGKLYDAIVQVKFFGGSWTWYATEFDGKDTFFGYVVSGLGPDCSEFGYFTLSELASLRFPPFGHLAAAPDSGVLMTSGFPIERDLYFTPKPLRECQGVQL